MSLGSPYRYGLSYESKYLKMQIRHHPTIAELCALAMVQMKSLYSPIEI